MWLNVWRTFVQLFYVAVVVLVFLNLQGRLETITVALAGMLYTAIRGIGINNVFLHRSQSIGLRKEVDQIKAAVIPGFVPEFSSSQLEENLIKANTGTWFDYTGLGIISFICLIELLLAISKPN